MRCIFFVATFACCWSTFAGETEVATPISTPVGAFDVARHSFNDGHAFQTDFKLIAKFPANPAFGLYAAKLDQSWTSCVWGKEWDHILDGRKSPPVMIHQTAHVWLNAAARRFIMLSVRYFSSDKCSVERPENDEQHVVIVEYTDVDPSQIRSQLGLACTSE
jgi:hypothetical protein